MEEDDSAVGTRFIAIQARSLNAAVDQLISLGGQLDGIKVNSGEHLAAILLTAFLGRPPSEIDNDGGVDFLFDLDHKSGLSDILGNATRAAFEVKSLKGGYRRAHAIMERDEQRGMNTVGRETSVVFQLARDIVLSAFPQLTAAGQQLNRKAPLGSSRNAFLIVHPFEYISVEQATRDVMAPHMPSMPAEVVLDSVWILWFPDHLTVWSRATSDWTELFFRAFREDDFDSEIADPSVLQAASSRLLSRIRPGASDPYLFGFSAGPDEAASDQTNKE
ncbi:hypothetical protein [Actinoplanes sp. NPDC049599]|uniref:hypothetical protein n=1 Tax=Actinoplanes sp. NPDC049599 TaxID=3363903 RepID=UPI00379B6A88